MDKASIARRHSRARLRVRGRRRPPAQRLRLELTVWWRAAELDRQLAAGASPRTSDALTLRAQRITTRRSRAPLANGLAGALRSAQDNGPHFTSAVRPNAREVLDARAVLGAIERRLRAPEPVAAQGVAMIRSLLTDGNGLLYRPGGPGELGSRLRAAAAALEPAGSRD
jgi:hypothetical protein